MAYEHINSEQPGRGYEQASSALAEFIARPGHDRLATMYGIELPIDPADRLLAMQALATAHWDFRKKQGNAERQQTDWSAGDEETIDARLQVIDTELSVEQSPTWQTVFEAADELGLVHSSAPRNRHPNYLAVLGGANLSALLRLQYGLQSVDDFDTLVYLGAAREVTTEAELNQARTYAPDPDNLPETVTEFTLGCWAFEKVLGGQPIVDDSKDSNPDTLGWRAYEFQWNGQTKVGYVFSTPREVSDRSGQTHRATTYDNYRLFGEAADLRAHPEASIVAVTNAFYTEGQQLPAVQELALPFGVQVETIGYDAAYSGNKRQPRQLLQETKSAIDAAVRLQTTLAAGTIK